MGDYFMGLEGMANGLWDLQETNATVWGCTTTLTRPISISKSQRASIISKPLLKRVAESIVIFRPITQDGCFSARSTVMLENSAFGVVRKGPPEAVNQSLRIESEDL